jgi:hypothetical protein
VFHHVDRVIGGKQMPGVCPAAGSRGREVHLGAVIEHDWCFLVLLGWDNRVVRGSVGCGAALVGSDNAQEADA